jgi:unsaturated rhamnogalacturonyl hydrolase
VNRAWLALTGLLDADGNLGEVCVGTARENDVSYYLDRPRVAGDLHGQAPLLWLATELLRPLPGADHAGGSSG